MSIEYQGGNLFMDQTIIRDVKLEDVAEIKAIICETWDWKGEFIQSDTTLNAAVGMYMNDIFYHSTFAKVAVYRDKIVGMIFGSVKGEIPTCRLLQESALKHTLTLLHATPAERQNIEEYMSKLHHTYGKLIEGKENLYGGCLEFLIVSKEARGLKLGKKLVDELICHFKDKNVKSFYLYSDLGCNYGFYGHNGFTLIAEQEMNFQFSFGNEMDKAFLYDYQIN